MSSKVKFRFLANDRRKGKFSITEFQITPSLVCAVGRREYENGVGKYFCIGIVFGHWHIAGGIFYIKIK